MLLLPTLMSRRSRIIRNFQFSPLTTPSSQVSRSPAPKSKQETERIFGVVPAYRITDARNAPPLKSREKFELFTLGTLDPFPVVIYAMQAGVEQARDTHSGYGRGAAEYGKRF